MANFVSDQILDRIRQSTDIVGLVQESLPLRKAGSAYKALCPFHREKTPSFHVNPERQIFKCFGCGAGGDVFSYVMKTEGVDFVEAVGILAERARIELPSDGPRGPGRGEKDKLYEVNAWAAETFHGWLMERPFGKSVLAYLEKRGVSLDTVKQFKLGCAPAGWDSLMKSATRKGYPEALLATAGLLSRSERSDGMYDRFRNRLMFPIRDTQNRVIAFGARALDDSEPKYLNSPETPLFAKGSVLYGIDLARHAFREKRQAIVVEGYMDAIMAHQHGVPRTIGVLGTALTRDHVRLLRRYVDEAVLVFDADEAGQNSASRSVDAFAAEELAARIVSLPDGLDPDDFLRQRGVDAFLEIVDSAVDGLAFKLARALASVPRGAAASSVPVARALDDVLATVALMPNSVAQSMEVKKISDRTRVPEQSIHSRLRRLTRFRRSGPEEAAPVKKAGPARDAERELLVAMLTYPATVAIVRAEFDLARLRNPLIRGLIESVVELSDTGQAIAAADLLARTQEEPQRALVEAVIGSDPVRLDHPEAWCRDLLNEIEARAHQEASRALHQKVVEGGPGDRAEQDRILTERLRAAREAQRKRGKLNLKEA